MKLRAKILFTVLLVTGSLVAQDTKENAEFKLALNLYNSGMYDLAVDQFQNFINAYPGTASGIEARFYLGLTQMKLQRYEDARMTLQNFALTHTDNPKAPQALLYVGDAFAALNNHREAASAYERVKVFYPASPLAPEALLKAAHFHRALNQNQHARKALRTIIQDYSTSSSAHSARLALGELYAAEGRDELAQQEFSRVIESSTDGATKARALLLLARLYALNGQEDEAETLLKRIATTHTSTPSYHEALVELGILSKQRGRYNEAINHLKKVTVDTLAGAKLREQALLEIGDCYAAAGDHAQALKTYDQFLSLFPGSAQTGDVLFVAGKVALSAKQHQKALGYFEKSLQSRNDSLNRKALVHHAEVCVELREYRKAIQSFTAFLASYPSDPFVPAIIMRIGNLYEDYLRDYRRALAYYDDIVSKYATSHLIDDALFAIARCREAEEQYDGALAAYQELVRQYPSSELTPAAEAKIEFLRNHKLKDLRGGLDRLAHLIGQQIKGISKGRLALTLGDIYASDLKNYQSAAEMFAIAIDSSANEEQRLDALFRRARAYHLISDVEADAAGQAIASYETFLQQYPASRWSDDAALYSLQLKRKVKAAGEIIPLIEAALSKRPNTIHRGELLLMLANAQSSDRPRDAIATYNRLVKEIHNGPEVETAWLQLGNLYTQLGSTDSAVRAYTTLVTEFPHSVHAAEALWLLANMRLDQKKHDEAAALFQRLTSEHFYSPLAQRAESSLGEVYLESGQHDEAIRVFASIAELDGINPFPHEQNYQIIFKLATVNNHRGNTQKAIELYRAYLQHDRRSPLAAEVYIALGVMASERGRVESASAYFKRAAVIGGGAGATRELAELLFQTGQYDDAEKQFSILARDTPNESEKQYFASRAIISRLRRDDLKSAEPMVKEFTKTYRKNTALIAEIEYERGLYHYRKQDYTNARKVFSAVADDYDDTKFAAWGEYYLGKIFEVTNKPVEAVKKYESILKRYPKSEVIPRVHLSLGNISYNAEKYQDAIVQYRKIVDSPDAPSDVLPYAMNNLIDAYEAIQLYDAALQTTRTFIERFPNDPGIMDKRINIGVLYIRLGYHDQAIVHLQKILDEAGSDHEAEIRYAIGEAYYSKGDYQQAILEFLKVPYLVTRHGKIDWTATSFYMAGQAYEKMSKFDQAISMYQQIIDRPGIDGTFKAAAKKEIDRVKTVIKGSK